ncbi:MAG: hypothetical protein KY464_09350 [Gemmatimonadetes bacterium]|nr:hypothetical protein [Gemmatimonadota bacterium]
MSAFRLLGLTAAALLVGCAQLDPGAAAESSDPPPLLASVKASTLGTDSALFSLQITNTAATPLELRFNSGQSFDFVVTRGAQEIWRWSSEQMFTQALRSETLAPGETRTYTATWAPVPRVSGEFTVRARLTAQNAQTEQTTSFRL